MSALRAALAPLALLVLVDRKDELVFRVPAETTLVRSLESEFTLDLESMALTMDGEEVPAEYFGEVDIRLEHAESYVVTDVVEAAGQGRPQRLRRTFDELGGREQSHFSSDEGEENDDSEYESALEGKSVLFSWNEAAGRFDAAFAQDQEGDEALLEDLDEDMDLRRFLPGGPVAEGESWEIDPSVFTCILDPGGELALEVRGEESQDTSSTDAQLRQNLDGTLTATYRGSRNEDGLQLATIALAVDARTHAEDQLAADELPEGGTGTGRVEAVFRLEGALLWDLEHGHAHALELSGEYDLTMTQSIHSEFEGESVAQTQTMVFKGETRFSMGFERK